MKTFSILRRSLASCARLAAVLASLAVLGSLAVGAAVAQPSRTAVVITIGPAEVAGKWRQGWFGLAFSERKGSLKVTRRGTVRIGGTVDTAATLRVVIRPLNRSAPPTAQGTVETGPGQPYSTTLRLPIRPLPGTYRITVGVLTPAGAVVGKVTRDFEFEAPPEGIVRRAVISGTKDGPGRIILRSRHEAWARFYFRVPPSAPRKVTIQWRTPHNELICQTKSGILPNCELRLTYKQTIYTYLRSPGTKLERGDWYCELTVNGRLARRAFVRLR